MLNLLLPATFKNFRFYPESILSIDLTQDSITAIKISIGYSGLSATFRYFKSFESFDPVSRRTLPDKDLLKETFEELFAAAGKFDYIHMQVPSTFAAFKDLVMPLSEQDQIKKLLPFEVEPYLVFGIEEASIDSITTKELPDNKARVMAAAIKDADFAKVTNIFKSVDQTCHNLYVDTILLYQTYQQEQILFLDNELALFIEITDRSINAGFVDKGSLSNIRVFEYGILDLVKDLEKKLGTNKTQVLEILSNSGIKESPETSDEKAIFQGVNKLFEELFFAAEAFVINIAAQDSVNKIVIFQPQHKIANIENFLERKFSCKAEVFSSQSWLVNQKISGIHPENSLEADRYFKAIAAVKVGMSSDFNLGYKLFPNPDKKVMKYQFIISIALILAIFGIFIFSGISKIYTLSSMCAKKEEELIESFKKMLPADAQKKKKFVLKSLVSDIETSLQKKATSQRDFGYFNLPDYLGAMLEITRLVDRTRFGIVASELSFKLGQDEKYNLLLTATFDTSKSVSKVDEYAAFIKLLSLSKRLTLLESKSDADQSKGIIKFSLTMGLNSDENI